jgi:pimeloyl-ACP methyl ester carboxylesterase
LRTTLRVPDARTVVMGRSLGTGVAAEMAHRGYGSRLVLISPYTSIADVAARSFSYLPTRLLVRDRFDTAKKAPTVRQPTLILHGDRDEVIPHAMGETLARAFPDATFHSMRGSTHNDPLSPEAFEVFRAFVLEAR